MDGGTDGVRELNYRREGKHTPQHKHTLRGQTVLISAPVDPYQSARVTPGNL